MLSRNGASAADRIEFRIGIPAGDILKDNDIFGQRVNIAARLERSPSPAASVSRFGCDPRFLRRAVCWRLSAPVERSGRGYIQSTSEHSVLYLTHLSEATEPHRPGRDLHGRLGPSLAAVADRIHVSGHYRTSNGVYRSGPPELLIFPSTALSGRAGLGHLDVDVLMAHPASAWRND